MKTLKEEFEERFVDVIMPIDLALKSDVDEIWSWIETKLKEACKEQRENCNKSYQRTTDEQYINIVIVDAILNASLPKQLEYQK